MKLFCTAERNKLTNLNNCGEEPWKNLRASTRFEPVTSANTIAGVMRVFLQVSFPRVAKNWWAPVRIVSLHPLRFVQLSPLLPYSKTLKIKKTKAKMQRAAGKWITDRLIRRELMEGGRSNEVTVVRLNKRSDPIYTKRERTIFTPNWIVGSNFFHISGQEKAICYDRLGVHSKVDYSLKM